MSVINLQSKDKAVDAAEAVLLSLRKPALKQAVLRFTFSLAMVSGVNVYAEKQEAEQNSEEGESVEEIFVHGWRSGDENTARLPLTVRQVPQSLSLMSREYMDLTGITNINDVMMNVTGINVTLYDSQRPLYFARGFQITDFQVDGIPTYSSSTNQEYDTALYQSIEVIRGANGLFNGIGKPSGTVNMTRKRPLKEFGGSLTAQVGSWDKRRGVGDVSVPLTSDGSIRSRAVVAYQDSDSFRDRYRENKLALLAIVEADPSENTTVALGYQNQDNNPEGTIWGTIPIFAADGAPAEMPVSTSFSPNWTEWQRESGTLFADIEHRFADDWVFRGAYNRTKGDYFSLRVYALGFPDRETGEGMQLLASVGGGEDTRDSLDLQLTGSYTAFGREHDLILGANGYELQSVNPVYTSLGDWSYNVPDAWNYNGEAPLSEYSRTGEVRTTRTEQWGVYLANRFRITDALSLLGGGRLNNWQSGDTEVDNEITPYIGLMYDLNTNLTLYTSYTDVFSPQNYKNKNNRLLEPVVGPSVEAGIKGEFLDEMLTASLAVFNTRQDNVAVRDETQPENSLPDGSSAYITVDGTESNGVEVSVDGYLSSRWMINAGYTYVDTNRHANDAIWTNLPEHSIQFSTHYQLSGALEKLTLGGGINWQSETTGYGVRHPELEEGAVFEQDAYTLANLYATWRFNRDWSASLRATNLFDEVYWANIDYANYGEPQNVSLSLTWNY